MDNKVAEGRILLFGDAIKDVYFLPLIRQGASDPEQRDWRNHDQFLEFREDGGVHMLASMLDSFRPGATTVYASGSERRLESLALLCDVELDTETGLPDKARPVATDDERLTAPTQEEELHLRVERYLGYRVGEPAQAADTPPDNVPPHALVVIADAGNDLREEGTVSAFLKRTLTETAAPVVLKTHLPLGQGLCWAAFKSAKTSVRRIVIVHVEDLRQHGVRLDRSATWDGMVEVMRDRMRSCETFRALLLPKTVLIVLFGVEAAVIIETVTGPDDGTLRVIIDPAAREDETDEDLPGMMVGKMNAFVAALCDEMLEMSHEAPLVPAVADAMQTMRAFATDSFAVAEGGLKLRSVQKRVESERAAKGGRRVHFLTLKPDMSSAIDLLRDAIDALEGDDYGEKLRRLAQSIVRDGPDATLATLPHGRIGHLRTLDRREIDSLRTIGSLIRDYAADRAQATPISFAVFGPPGAGKSFGVKQLVDKEIHPHLEFNLSQATEADLPLFFQKIRDANLKNKVPLCFFDEFDSGERRLLKNFLAPMQDGEYRDGDAIRPVGRGIYIFAGGTAFSFEEFAGLDRDDLDPKTVNKLRATEKTQKLPDFVSRLSGYLNVRGVGGADRGNPIDPVAYLHRALLLRSMLETKFPAYAPKKRRAAISEYLVDWLLDVWSPQHGARSLETILRGIVSRSRTGVLGGSDLPGEVQQKIHTAL